jgi:predicted nucleic acid-binding protein
MNRIIIDTNPLAYIYHAVPDFGKNYAILLGELSRKNILIIPKIVYGELSLIFKDDKELNSFLKDTGIVIGEMKQASYINAAKRWQKYNKRRVLMCQRCGGKLERLICKRCDSEIKIRQHILTDFLIGAFALETKERKIVTHDLGYYSSYFPELNIISSNCQATTSL